MEQKEVESKTIIPFQNDNLAKSNFLISAKYKTSVEESKIQYMALKKIQDKEYIKKPDGVYVEMSAAEIRNKLDNHSGSFYKKLAKIANHMTSTNYGVMDEENDRFEFITLINKATYENNTFTIRFANEFEDHLIGIRKNFTYLPENVMMKFKKDYSFRLYELLKSQCYYPKDYKGRRDNVFLISIGLAELKLDIGIVNSNLDSVQNILQEGNGEMETYERAVEKASEQKYKDWYSFNRDCLKPNVDEINEVSDIYVTYEPVRSGRKGSYRKINFTVYLDGAETNDHKDEVIPVGLTSNGEIEARIPDQDKFLFWIKVNELFEGKLNIDEIIPICEAAGYDIDAIKRAKSVLSLSHTKIDNVTGWIIAAIKSGYTAKEHTPKESFQEFQQADYDISELEKRLLEE